jgi:hypothetical protein
VHLKYEAAMVDWFEELVVGVIWKAIDDALKSLAGKAETEIITALRGLTAGQQLASSPLVKVLAVDNAADTVTLLVRGAFSFSGTTPFLRVEVVVSRSNVHLTGGAPPIDVLTWQTVIGDLKIVKDGAFEGSLGFGVDGDAMVGEGSLKLLPIKAGAAIYGGISDRGMVLGLDAEIPPGAAVPLGPTGLGLRGLGGDFAYNFMARLEEGGIEIPKPSAKDYVVWARDRASIDRWKAAPIDKTTVGVGIRTVLCTMADQGFAFELNPIGFSLLTPGALVLGGKGVLLKRKGFGAEGYFVVDVASASLALGVGVNIEIKAIPDELNSGFNVTLLKGSGQLDMFFSFSDPTAWSLDVGTESRPVRLEVLTDVPVINILFSEKAEAYFRINHHRISFGAKIGIGGSFKVGRLIELVARLETSFAAYIGWDPFLVRAQIKVLGELGIKVWEFGFLISGEASPTVYFPSPTLFRFEVSFKLDLPWPIPDISASKAFGDDIATPPGLTCPLLAGEYDVSGARTTQGQNVVATHVFMDRQWALGTEKPWPDVDLVVPFSRRVTDDSGSVVGAAVSSRNEGGYDVVDRLTRLELLDLTHGVPVAGAKAVWVDGPDGGTPLLHVLGTDPFSWITPQTDTASYLSPIPPLTVDIFFGAGPSEMLTDVTRFGNVLITPPAGGATLTTSFEPTLSTRVLRTSVLDLSFRDALGAPIQVDEVNLFLVGFSRSILSESTVHGAALDIVDLGPIFAEVRLTAVTFRFLTPRTDIQFLVDQKQQLLVWGIRYREAADTFTVTSTRTLLVPGHYRLTIEGRSTAVHPEFSTHPELYPSAPAIDWRVVQEFHTTYPGSLRPYIYYATLGDSRIFSKVQHPWTTWTAAAWDPTLLGVGFPAYRNYHVVVRFLVPYLGAVFSDVPLKMRIAYEDGTLVDQTMTPAANPDGEGSLLPQSQTWIAAHGGSVAPDQEIVLLSTLPVGGAAALILFFDDPGGDGEVVIDQWSGYVSRFMDFRGHVAWPATALTSWYDAAGHHTRPQCASLHPFRHSTPRKRRDYFGSSGMDAMQIERMLPGKTELDFAVLDMESEGDLGAELTIAPPDWRLPAALKQELEDLGPATGLRFIEFCRATGVRFNDGSGDSLDGIHDTVSVTTIEAVVDGASRPYAIWLRTPEPLDWRRVTASLRIKHVTPASGCPTSYAKRSALDLAVELLPSPDGSSVLIVGAFAGDPVRLPRGEYTLKMTFDSERPGLPKLRPSASVGSLPETGSVRFIQPLGQDWPAPSTGITVPRDLLDLLIEAVPFDPSIWVDGWQAAVSASEIRRRIEAIYPPAPPDPWPAPRGPFTADSMDRLGERVDPGASPLHATPRPPRKEFDT